MNGYVERLFELHLDTILNGDGVAIPDDPEEMNWRIFFAHSQDMQGFRADIFTGGPNEPEHLHDPHFVPLRQGWGERSRQLMGDLGSLWDDEPTRVELARMSNPMRSKEERAKGIAPALDLLASSDKRGAQVFGETLRGFSGPNVARKTNAIIRSYVQNSHLLKHHDYSYRSYLLSLIPDESVPPRDVLGAETIWTNAIQRDFYNVGPALANYMICDWLLWMWREGRIDWFASYKADSVHENAIKSGKLPNEAHDFVTYCRTVTIPDGHGAIGGKPCPPRVLNECIWLDGNRSSA